MLKRAFSGIILTLVFISVGLWAFHVQPVKSDPKIWTVDDDGPADFHTIQEAIDTVNPGDIIYVYNGSYYEHLVINKSLSLIGENMATPAIIAVGNDSAVYASANDVTISGFEIQNPTFGNWWAITLNRSSNSIIEGNIVEAVSAIRVVGGSGNKILNNSVVGTPDSCVIRGLTLTSSNNNLIAENYLSNDCHYAFTMHNSNHNYITLNYISGHFGPFTFTITRSNSNLITRNTIWQLSPWYGGHIDFWASNENILHHNSFLADDGPVTISIEDNSMNNTWDNGCEGNHWSNYNGTDSDDDGIGDTPYIIDENNTDRYPLLNLYWNPCDINHDLKVDMKDIGTSASAFYTEPGDERWNCRADITGPEHLVPDQIVNMRDIGLIARNFGETDP